MAAGQKEFWACFAILASKATAVYKFLEPLVAPDFTPDANGKPVIFQEPDYYRNNYVDIKNAIDRYVALETTASTKISALTKVPTQQTTPPAPPAPLVTPLPQTRLQSPSWLTTKRSSMPSWRTFWDTGNVLWISGHATTALARIRQLAGPLVTS